MIHALLGNPRIRLIAVILLILVPALALILYTTTLEWSHDRLHAREDALREVQIVANRHELLIQSTRQVLVVLSQWPQVRQRDAAACEVLFAGLRKEDLSHIAFGAVDLDGNLFACSMELHEPVNVADNPSFREMIEKRDFTISPGLTDIIPGKATIIMTYPAMDPDGKMQAIVFAALDLEWLNNLAAQTDLPKGSDFTLIDSRGTILVRYPDRDRWFGEKFPDNALSRTVLREKEGVAEGLGLDGVEKLFAFMPLSGRPGQSAFVIVGVPIPLAYREAGKADPQALIGVLALLLILAAWYLGDKLFLRRVTLLKGAARSIASGDLRVRTGITSAREDIGDLLRSFDEMAEALDRQRDELRRSEARYRVLVEQIPAIAYTARLDRQSSTTYIGPQITALVGYTRDEWLTPDLWLQCIHPEDRGRVLQQLERTHVSESPFACEYRMRAKDGRTIWVRDEAVVVRDGDNDAPYLHGILIDITGRKADQEAMEKLNRTLHTLSDCNQSLVHVTSEKELLESICRTLTEIGGYHLACVGFGGNGTGYEIGVLRRVGGGGLSKLSGKDREQDLGIAAAAMRSAESVISRSANGCEYKSVIGLPLLDGDVPFGCLTIYSRDHDAFDDEEVLLLRELSEDLAYGIVSLRTRVQRDRAEKAAERAGIELQETLESLRKAVEGTIGAMASTVESRDPYTAGHQKRVSDIAGAIAVEMGLPAEKVEGIRMAGLIHDLGKIAVPAEILSKPGRISEHEFAIIKGHPQTSYEILKTIEFPWPVAQAAWQHHERLDGTGYPQKLRGDEIIMEARIIAVADVIEAMAGHRPYRAALGLDPALREIEKGRGSAYDSDVVDACVRLCLAGVLGPLVR